MRLTVVTTFGLIGTLASGLLGMNLIAEADAPVWTKLGYFLGIVLVTSVLTLLTVAKSKPLSDFLEALSDGHVGLNAAFASLRRTWRTWRTL